MSDDSSSWSRRRFLKRTSAAGLAGASVTVDWALPATAALPGPNRDLLSRLRSIPAEHPRLHITNESLETLREQADTTHSRYRALLLDWTDRHRNDNIRPGGPTVGESLERAGSYVTSAALAALIGGRERDLELAREWTLAICTYPDGDLREYNLGVYAAGLARSYDWLYDEWTDDEKQQIREHLTMLIRQVYLGSFRGKAGVTRWWAPRYLHHDFWIAVGGYGEAALALLGEVEDAPIWAERAKRLFDKVFTLLGDDGSWHEGVADWCYAAAPLLWFFGAWETAVGDDLHEDNAWIENTADYRLYHWLPDDTYVHLDDSFRSGRYGPSGTASAHLLRRLASLYDDGHAQWLAEHDEPLDLMEHPPGVYQAPYESSSYSHDRRRNIWSPALALPWSLLWYDPSVESSSPEDLLLQKHFPNKDIAIFRTGWDDDEAVISLACGPLGGHKMAELQRAGEKFHIGNVSHGHTNYNSITLFADGEFFIVPPGYARRSSYFQNSIAVDGANFRYDIGSTVHIDTVTLEGDVMYARGDATDGFMEELNVQRFHRHLILVDGALVVIDDIRRPGGPHRMYNLLQWTLHHDPREHEVAIDGSSAVWTPRDVSDVRLRLDLLAPREFAWETNTMQDQDGIEMLESVRLIQPEWYDNTLHVTGVLSWASHDVDPRPVETGDLAGVWWAGSSTRPAVLIALEETSPEEARASAGSAVEGPAYVFSTNPAAPGEAVVVGGEKEKD